MLAAKDEYINEASNTIFQLSAEEQICKRCRDREEYYLDMRAHERELENRKKIIEENNKIIAENRKVIAKDKKVIAEKDRENKQLRALLKEHGIDIPLSYKK